MFFAFTIAQTKKNGPQTRFKNFLLSGFKIFAGVQCARNSISRKAVEGSGFLLLFFFYFFAVYD